MLAKYQRRTYLESIEEAQEHLEQVNPATLLRALFGRAPRDERGRELRERRASESDEFFHREWDVDGILDALRDLAKDLESASLYAPPSLGCLDREYARCTGCGEQQRRHDLYTKAVSLEYVDSVGDLQRKASHLLRILIQLDPNSFIFAIANDRIRELAERFELAAKIKRNWQELREATLGSLELEAERSRLQEQVARSQLSTAELQARLALLRGKAEEEELTRQLSLARLREQFPLVQGGAVVDALRLHADSLDQELRIETVRAQLDELRRRFGTQSVEDRAEHLNALVELEERGAERYARIADDFKAMVQSERLRLLNQE